MRGDSGGGWGRIKYEIGVMENIEHNTNIWCNVINEDYIEVFSSVEVFMRGMWYWKGFYELILYINITSV